MILKFRKNISEWYSLYANAIKNRLRRDLNLGDVCDVQETRDNIGLSGDNNHTHYHDDRYIPIIEKRINELDNKLNNIIPIGTIMAWPSNVPPDTYRWLECNGQSFNSTEFPDLYKVFPSGRVPDLRGVFLRGYGSQSSYTSGALGQLQGDAMRKIYGDIPNVQFGKALFGHYEFGPFILRGYSGYWPSGVNKWFMTSYPEYFPIYRYSITGSSESGYELIEQEYHIKTDIGVKQIDSTLGQGFQTVSFDSSKIIPTASEIRPANIAVKYYIRAN